MYRLRSPRHSSLRRYPQHKQAPHRSPRRPLVQVLLATTTVTKPDIEMVTRIAVRREVLHSRGVLAAHPVIAARLVITRRVPEWPAQGITLSRVEIIQRGI